MNQPSKGPGRAALGLLLALSLGGAACVHAPRVVRAISQSRDQVKFLYTEGDAQGILKCQVGPDGSLSSCRQMKVAFEK